MSIIEKALNKKQKEGKAPDSDLHLDIFIEKKKSRKKYILIASLIVVVLVVTTYLLLNIFNNKKNNNLNLAKNTLPTNTYQSQIPKDKKTNTANTTLVTLKNKEHIQRKTSQNRDKKEKNLNNKKNITSSEQEKIKLLPTKTEKNIINTQPTHANKSKSSKQQEKLIITKKEISRTKLTTNKKQEVVTKNYSKKENVNSLLLKAYNKFKRGEIAETIKLYTKVLSIDEKNIQALVNRSIAYQKIKEYTKAEKDLKKALSFSENKSQIYNALGVLLLLQNKIQEALAYFRRANTSEAYVNIALIMWKQNKIKNVYTNLKTAINLNPKNEYAHYYMGLYLKQLGYFSDATKEFERALILAKEKGNIYLIKLLSNYK